MKGLVIMSLWPMDDQSTRQWMTTLYEGRLMSTAAFVAAGDWR